MEADSQIRMHVIPWQECRIYPKGSKEPLKGVIQGRDMNR